MEIWSGIDVSKKTFVASWVPSTVGLGDFQSIPYREFERSPEGVRHYCRWMRQQGEGPTGVVMEATGRYSLELLVWLVRERPDLAPAIVNPRQAKHFHKGLGLRNKTDAVDARSLGLMGCQQKPRSYQAPAPEYRQLRELMRQRRDLVRIHTAEGQRLEELPAQFKGLLRILRSHLKHLQKLLQRLDRQVDQLLVDSHHLGRDLALLISIPGVGRVVALTVLGELGDLRRFERSRQVSAYSGLTPANQESGSSKKSSHLDRNGITELRAVLYLAAMSACCNAADNHMARTYQRLQHRGKTKKQALTVVARKILVMMRAILIHEKPYIDDFSRLANR
jgi:transposase